MQLLKRNRSEIFPLVPFLALLFSALPADAVEGHPGGELIVRLNQGIPIDSLNSAWGTGVIEDLGGGTYLIEPPAGRTVEELDADLDLDMLRVAASDPNYYCETPEGQGGIIIVAIGSEYTAYCDQGAFDRIRLPEAHQIAVGEGSILAFLDTGVDLDHPALSGRLSSAGYDFIDDDAEPAETANGIDDDMDGLTDEGYGHGTMVAGILAATAPGATLLPIRVLDDEGIGTLEGLIRGIRYAVDQGADVINMSLGLTLDPEPLKLVVLEAQESGAILVAAAGNIPDESVLYYPASYNHVLSVAAVDSNDVKASFSAYNDGVDMTAPGDGIYSAYPGDQYAMGGGTSFASPFVAGAAALALSIGPPENPHEIEEGVVDNAFGIDEIPGNELFSDFLGEGRLDVFESAVDMLDDLTTGVAEGAGSPGRAAREIWAAPNPFLGETGIYLSLPGGGLSASPVEIGIFSASGRAVRTARLSSDRSGNGLLFRWDGRDERGAPVAAGRYMIRATVGGETIVRSMTLLR